MATDVYKLPNGETYFGTNYLLRQLIAAGADRTLCGELQARFMRQAVENMEMRGMLHRLGVRYGVTERDHPGAIDRIDIRSGGPGTTTKVRAFSGGAEVTPRSEEESGA